MRIGARTHSSSSTSMFHLIANLQDAPIISMCQILCGGDVADRLNVDQLGELGAAELLVSARFSFAPPEASNLLFPLGAQHW